MVNLKEVYRRLDNWIREFSRGQYAILTGVTVALGVLVVSSALADPDYTFALGIGLVLTLLYYWHPPKQMESDAP